MRRDPLVLGLLLLLLTFLVGFLLSKLTANISYFQPPEAIDISHINDSVEHGWPPENPSAEVPDGSTLEENFAGWYSLHGYAGMKEVNMILVDREVDSETGKLDKDFSGGGVFTRFEDERDQGFVEDSWFEFDAGHIKFRTKKIHGFEYRFDGRFFKNRAMGVDGEKLLRGTLQKFKKR
jgi:hypothetical protein